MKFFLDRNLPHRLARMLDSFDAVNDVRHHDDYFEPTATDEYWLGQLAIEEGDPWVIVSGDTRILQREKEVHALRSADLTFFSLAKAWSNVTYEEKAWKLVKVWPLITRESTMIRKPTIFEVPISATKIEPRGATKDWRR